MIYHIATQADWALAQQNGQYVPAAYGKEGFIHACGLHQIEGVLNRYFNNAGLLVVLHIDEKKLIAPHTFIFSPTVNDEFPHIFGPINMEAVAEITVLED